MKKIWIRKAWLATAAGILLAPSLVQATSYKFQTINNNTDPNFNQLLGINNTGTIAGYYGDATVVPNNGYTVTPPYGQGNFTIENVPGAAQTQVTGLNNGGVTVGFSVDANGNNTGFVHTGTTFTTPIVDPAGPPISPIAPTTNQLLGVNDHSIAAGFYVNSAGNAQAYTYNISSKTFTAINPTGATAATAAGINNASDVAGFAVIGGTTEGFYYNGTTFSDFLVPGSTSTVFFGLNNKGLAVGDYVDASGLTNGLVYNVLNGSWQTVNNPNASPTTAFGVNGTTINGINDLGQLVGFYSDGTHVNGMLATPTPEPASFALMGLGTLLAIAIYRRRRA
jgi:PEP-CTERM motif